MRLQNYLIEPEITEAITYDFYTHMLDYVCSDEYTEDGLNEGVKEFFASIKDGAVGRISDVFKTIKKDLSTIADDFGMGAKDVVDAFKSKNMFNILKAFGFNVKSLFKSVNTLSNLVRKGLFGVFKEIEKSGALKKIKQGTMKVDDLINKYPILNKVGGVAVAGLLFFIWTQMTFIGDLDFDMDFSLIKDALSGNYSLADLFVSPQGLMLLTLFATGGLVSVPWMGSTLGNLVIALTYTGFKQFKGNPSILNKLKSKIKMA